MTHLFTFAGKVTAHSIDDEVGVCSEIRFTNPTNSIFPQSLLVLGEHPLGTRALISVRVENGEEKAKAKSD